MAICLSTAVTSKISCPCVHRPSGSTFVLFRGYSPRGLDAGPGSTSAFAVSAQRKLGILAALRFDVQQRAHLLRRDRPRVFDDDRRRRIAVIIYRWLGLKFCRTWFNLDIVRPA
jgi:hypothetical protein